MMESLQKGKIFVVDDEPANLKLVYKVLQHQEKLELVLIQDPRDVVSLYQKEHPDLILLDLNMPHLSGYEVMSQLQKLEDPLLPPIVVLSAQGSSEFLLKSLMMGARDFIQKPFDRTELIMRINNLLDAHLAHRMIHERKAVLEEIVDERTRELKRTQLQMVRRLGMAAEYKDEETGNHILRMSHICSLLAEASGWSKQEVDVLLNSSPMHDIGKIGIPDKILLKPGKLDPQEWEIMQSHTVIGMKLLEGDDCPLLVMARDIAYTHHERWDGSGYPRGLKGEDIPQCGRIVALADVFDALTSARPYKQPWAVDEAVEYIRDNRGKHFDPSLVDIFLQNLDGIKEIRERFSDKKNVEVLAIPA
ncbi:MAG: response regulator [Gammaproteobacteria bacterium]|nr:MAG: response regulator [Gammaproteobacteria bacterium]